MSYAVFVRDDVSLPVFKVPLQRNATEISPDWGLALFCLSLKKKNKNQIYCPLAICSSQFAALFLHFSAAVDFFFFCFSLHPFVPLRLFDWRSRGVKQCWKSERRWMERLKECESEGEWLGLGWLVWVSLGCGGAPLCWMSGRDRIGDHWHLGVKGGVRTTEKHFSSVLCFKRKIYVYVSQFLF